MIDDKRREQLVHALERLANDITGYSQWLSAGDEPGELVEDIEGARERLDEIRSELIQHG